MSKRTKYWIVGGILFALITTWLFVPQDDKHYHAVDLGFISLNWSYHFLF